MMEINTTQNRHLTSSPPHQFTTSPVHQITSFMYICGMRWVILLIGILIILCGVANGQQVFNYKAVNRPIKDVLKDITELYPVEFYYSSSRIAVGATISVNVSSASLDELLSSVLNQVNIRYKINGIKVILSPSEKVPLAEIYSLSGFISDFITGERLIGANIIISDISKGTVSNNYGYFIYSLPAGVYSVKCSYMGYQSTDTLIQVSQNSTLHFRLLPEITFLQEVELKAGSLNKVKNAQLGTVQLPLSIMRSQPSLLAESDVIQCLKMMPGIQTNTDGFNGLYVRGGMPHQTSFILDDAPLFNMYHISGWFSSVNSNSVKEVNVHKSHLPSKTGGAVSSVVDIRLRDGNNKNFAVTGGVGVLTSQITIEGPIVKDRSSFILSGRRSYLDKLIQLFKIEDTGLKDVYFYDFNGKINYTLNNRNRLYLSSYLSNDAFADSGGISWGNALYSFRWNHIFSEKLFSNLTLSGSNSVHRFYGADDESIPFQLSTGIKYHSLRYDFTFYSSSNQKINFGFNGFYQEILPLHSRKNHSKLFEYLKNDVRHQRIIYNLYSEGDFSLLRNFSLLAGIRLSLLQNIEDSAFFEIHPEPVVTVRYNLKKSLLKAGYSRNYQYHHGASVFDLLIPFERLIFSDTDLKAQFADHFSAGYSYIPHNGSFELSLEPFVSLIKNQFRFYAQNELLMGMNYKEVAIAGNTDVYGIEFSLRKTTGRFTGMANYTWSKIDKQEFNQQVIREFNPFFDRRHDIALSSAYDISKRLGVSASWVYMTGNPYNQPNAKYEIRGRVLPVYSDDLYNKRMPPYHRMDVAAKYKFGRFVRFRHNITFSVYNIYGRKNSLFYFYSDGTGTAKQEFQMFGFHAFRFFPSLSYEFSFR
jgi:hypothetical protein